MTESLGRLEAGGGGGSSGSGMTIQPVLIWHPVQNLLITQEGESLCDPLRQFLAGIISKEVDEKLHFPVYLERSIIKPRDRQGCFDDRRAAFRFFP